MLSLPMPVFRLQGEEDFVDLSINEVWGYPNETNYAGGYGAKGILTIQAGEFAVTKATHYFTTGELYRFLQQLRHCYNTLDGTAILENTERELTLTCLFDRKGHVLVEGSFQSNPSVRNILTFEFTTDQTKISQMITSLLRIASIFGDDQGVRK